MTTTDGPTEGQLIGLVRKHLYVPDGKPPAGYSVGRDVGILRALRKQGHTTYDLADAIEGLALLRDKGELDWAPRRSKMTLRALHNTGHGVRALIDQAREAVHKSGPRARARMKVVPKGHKEPAATPLGDLLGNVLQKAQGDRRAAPPPDPGGGTPDRGGRRSAATLNRDPEARR